MAGYSYHVVPFYAKVKTGIFTPANAGDIAAQLQAVIDSHTAQGWEFYAFGDVDVNVAPGCIASLLGARGGDISYDMLVFRAPKS